MNFSSIGALVQTFPAGLPIPVHLTYMGPAMDMRAPVVSIGSLNLGVNGPTYFFIEPGPSVQPPYIPPITISNPIVPPPVQLSTVDGTLIGNVNGVNNTFIFQVYCHRARVFRNGVLQTQNVDVGVGPTAIKFSPGSIPQLGDIVTILGYANW